MRLRATAPWLLIGVALAAGCTMRARPAGARFAMGQQPPATTAPPTNGLPTPERQDTAGKSVQGRAIDYFVFGDAPSATETVLFIAGIHGDEPAGTPLLQALVTQLRAEPSLAAGRRVVIVPAANPDGLALGTRGNSRGVDLNRNLPADNRQEGDTSHGPGALSEPESTAIVELVARYQPMRVVSFHQPLACVDYDGPGAQIWAWRFSTRCDLAVRKLGIRPGSLGAYLGETLSIPTLTIELPGQSALSTDDLWSSYGESILAMIEPEMSERSSPAPASPGLAEVQ